MCDKKLETAKHILGLIEDTRKLRELEIDSMDVITPIVEELDKSIKELTGDQLGIRLTIKK